MGERPESEKYIARVTTTGHLPVRLFDTEYPDLAEVRSDG